MATEIIIFPIKQGDLPDDLNNDLGKIFKNVLEKILQQPGAQRAYWGVETENPENARLFIDWSSIDAHMAFTEADIYKSFVDDFSKITDLSKVQLFHANHKPHPPSQVLSKTTSPATEILLMYFPTDYSKADQDEFEKDLKKLFVVTEENSGTYTADAGGWVVEELLIPGTEEKAKAYSAFVGWTSVQAHLDFKEVDAFKENIHLLRGAKDLKKLEIVHYHGNELK